MGKTITACAVLLALVLCVQIAYAAMSDSSAMTQAFRTWGQAASLKKVRKFGASNWTFEVGFDSAGCRDSFTVMGSALNSWDAAFAVIPTGTEIGGIYSGVVQLNVDAAALGIPLSAFQFKMDGQPLGVKLTSDQFVQGRPTLQWDTTQQVAGFHVLCGTYWDASGNSGVVHAVMLKVDQSVPAQSAPPAALKTVKL